MNNDTNNTEVSTFTKTIWVSKKDVFEKKMQHLNRILKKHGKDPITFRYENYRTQKFEFTTHIKGDAFKNDMVEDRLVEVCDVVCTGMTVVKKGDKDYTYIGTVAFKDGVKSVFVKDENYLPYFDAKFRDDMCDHCGTKRRNRKAYHLFVTDNGETVLQIGSKCAKEYFGFASDAFLNVQMNTFTLVYDGGWEELADFNRGSLAYNFKEVYTYVDYCTKGFTKWVKREDGRDPDGAFYDQPTAGAVAEILRMEDPHEQANYIGMNEISITQEECLEYWENKADTSFALNCRNALRAGYCTSKTVGAFAYAIFAAVNARIKERIRKEVNAGNQPCIYKKGERVVIKAKVITVKYFEVETFYTWRGETTEKCAINLKDENNTLYHLSTASTSFDDIKEGDTIVLKATIGDTKPWRDIDYTHLLRPKCQKVERNEGDSTAA